VGGSGPDSNCAWNGPGGCDGDSKRNGKKSGGDRRGKSLKAKKPAQSAVGSGLWTVEQWLKHG